VPFIVGPAKTIVSASSGVVTRIGALATARSLPHQAAEFFLFSSGPPAAIYLTRLGINPPPDHRHHPLAILIRPGGERKVEQTGFQHGGRRLQLEPPNGPVFCDHQPRALP
jgi:hypothetical protein